MQKQKRLITSALPYVNNVPHLGNIIGCVLSADVFARYCKEAGFDTLYVCGTDEYGTTTQTRAMKEGLTPQDLCDKYHEIHREIYDWFGIEFSYFGRTSTPKQTEIVQDIFWKLYNSGYIVEDTLTQPYCEKCDMFLADRFVEGTCPHCGYEHAKGDQCDNCQKLLNPEDLKDPKCTVCGHAPVFKKTKHLFLDLPKLGDILEKWIKESSQKSIWSTNALTVTKAWLTQGLEKRCITRDLKWGVPVPLKGFEGKVFYVWFDAPIGYISITASGFDNWQDWWKNPEEVSLYNFIGKDNIPFHTVLFPASLLGTGESWTLLTGISSTEYLNYENSKFSKSMGVGVFGDMAKDTGIDPDLFRYYLLRNRPEKNDTQFYWTDFMEKVNGEIIANYGNLVNRIFQFIFKFFDSTIPAFNPKELTNQIDVSKYHKSIIDLFEKIELKKSLLSILELCSLGNKYFQDSRPWEIIKTDRDRAGEIIGNLVLFVKDISILLWPFIPTTVEKVFDTLNLDKNKILIENLLKYEYLREREIKSPQILFKRIEKDFMEELRKKFAGNEENLSEIFSKLHLKVGKIIEVERHPKADKLYIEKVDMGNGEVRQIVSGLVPYYKKEELLNRKIIIAYNLKPAVLRGVKSEGMLLAAETENRSIVEIISPNAPIGSVVHIGNSTPNDVEITIEDFFSVQMIITDRKVKFKNTPITIDGKEISVEIVENGKVR